MSHGSCELQPILRIVWSSKSLGCGFYIVAITWPYESPNSYKIQWLTRTIHRSHMPSAIATICPDLLHPRLRSRLDDDGKFCLVND